MTTTSTTKRSRPPQTPEADVQARVLQGRLLPDMTFAQRVWTLTALIPAGRVATYSSIARKLGSRSPRAVGQALHRNPYAPAVPCHRVVATSGHLTGFAGGLDKKRALLRKEGVKIHGDIVDLSCLHEFE